MNDFWSQVNAAFSLPLDPDTTLEGFTELLRDQVDLTPDRAVHAMKIMVSGRATEAQQREFLIAMQHKGVAIDELAAFATTLRRLAEPIDVERADLIARQATLMDTCGTGGGTIETFNVSTTTMFILGAAGCVVAKHGNRALTSKCGSADVLEALGVKIDLSPALMGRCLAGIGIGFLYAPHYHKAFRHVQKIRKEIGMPTVFNFLGPLCNPAFYPENRIRVGQLLGVRSPTMMDPMIQVLRRLGLHRAYVVHGLDETGAQGMDEVSTLGKTLVAELTQEDGIKTYEIEPRTFNIPTAAPGALAGGNADDNARIVTAILLGKDQSAREDVAVFNAALGLCAGGIAASIDDGIARARECIRDGSAYRKLRELIEATSDYANL